MSCLSLILSETFPGMPAYCTLMPSQLRRSPIWLNLMRARTCGSRSGSSSSSNSGSIPVDWEAFLSSANTCEDFFLFTLQEDIQRHTQRGISSHRTQNKSKSNSSGLGLLHRVSRRGGRCGSCCFVFLLIEQKVNIGVIAHALRRFHSDRWWFFAFFFRCLLVYSQMMQNLKNK